MPLHYKAWQKALAEYGGTPTREDLFYAWGGKPVRRIDCRSERDAGAWDMPVDALAQRRRKAFDHAQLPELKGIPDVLEHIEAMHGRIPFAVVSGSRLVLRCRFTYSPLNLLDKFDVMVCAEDYTHGKPSPEGFLLAASKLGVASARLPRIRRHGSRHSSGDGCGYGLRSGSQCPQKQVKEPSLHTPS